jgi:5'-methylthioadenosine phosphorylase
MGRLAVVGGEYVRGLEVGDVPMLVRHGVDPEAYVQPHRIDHGANLRSLLELGCDRVLAIGSVGGLRAELEVGTFVCPHDFIALHEGGGTVFEDQRGHAVPGFDPEWRSQVIDAWSRLADVELVDGGVYWQAVGPRFETPAEIRLIAAHADVVGMTVGAESVVARELGLRYSVICMVDNLANGVGERELTLEELEAGRAGNRERLGRGLARVLPELAGEEAE